MLTQYQFATKKVLITGGLGFIGANLAIRLVALGADVTLVDSLIPEYGGHLYNIDGIKSLVQVNIADVRDSYSMNYLVQQQDYLFNLAGQTSHLDSMHNPYTDLDINARAQLSILEACRHHNPQIKIIFASTRQVYGIPRYLPVDECHPLQPVDVNGVNKLSGEWYHLLYYQIYGIRSVVLRLTNTYGPRMRVRDARQTFLGVWLKQLLCQQPLQVFGEGTQLRDFNYVDDVVEALLLAALAEHANGKIFNLGHAQPISLKDLACLLCRLSEGAHYECVTFPKERKAIDIGDYYANYQHIHQHLGWSPQVPLLQGLQQCLAYYRAAPENIYWDT